MVVSPFGTAIIVCWILQNVLSLFRCRRLRHVSYACGAFVTILKLMYGSTGLRVLLGSHLELASFSSRGVLVVGLAYSCHTAFQHSRNKIFYPVVRIAESWQQNVAEYSRCGSRRGRQLRRGNCTKSTRTAPLSGCSKREIDHTRPAAGLVA